MSAEAALIALFKRGPGDDVMRAEIGAILAWELASTRREAAVTVRAQAPKYPDNEVDQAIFWALDKAAGLIDPDKK